MSECAEFEKWMSLAVDGLLGGEETSMLKAHLQRCAKCRRTWQAVREISSLLGSSPMAAPRPDFTARVMGRLSPRRSLWSRLGVSAAFVTFLAAFVQAFLTGLTGLLLAIAFVLLLWVLWSNTFLLHQMARWGVHVFSLCEFGLRFLTLLLRPLLIPVSLSIGALYLLLILMLWFTLRYRKVLTLPLL